MTLIPQKTVNAIDKTIKGLAVIIILFLLSSCSKPKDLKIGEVHDIAVKGINLNGVELEGVVPVQNLNAFPVTIKDADLNLLADDKIIAHIVQTSPPVTIGAHSSADHTIRVRIDLLHNAEITSMMNLISGKSILNVDGTVLVSSYVFHKNVIIHQTNVQQYLKPLVDKFKLF